jgi:hypothetical protein
MSQGTNATGFCGTITYTTTQWATISTFKLPKGVLAAELTEAGEYKFKFGNGVGTWADLPYVIEAALTAEQKAMLAKVNTAGGVVQLDENGKIPYSAVPDTLTGTVVYVADITARNALPEDQKTGLVVVMDATGDTTVTDPTKRVAMYLWGNPPGEPDENEWVKIGESESIDINMDGYFDITKHTLDDVPDGTSFVKLSVEMKAKLDGIEEGADVTDSDNVKAAGAFMTDMVLFIQPPEDPAELAAMTFVDPVAPVYAE